MYIQKYKYTDSHNYLVAILAVSYTSTHDHHRLRNYCTQLSPAYDARQCADDVIPGRAGYDHTSSDIKYLECPFLECLNEGLRKGSTIIRSLT